MENAAQDWDVRKAEDARITTDPSPSRVVAHPVLRESVEQDHEWLKCRGA